MGKKTKGFLVAVILFLFLLITACSSKTTKDNNIQLVQTIEDLKKQLEEILKVRNVPGMSVAIVHRDGKKWVAGIGKADVASNRDATPDTLFRIASTSKGFVALSVLKLVEEGKLSLEDSIYELAPEIWFKNRWQATDPVRIVNLLEHTTGWDELHFREFTLQALSMDLLEAFDYDHNSRISRWQPGTRMAYCNSGPPVAAYIVEKITGMKFEDFVVQNFFQPLGMNTATFFLPDSESITTLYHKDGKTPFSYWNIIYRPTGSINASANDMANYLLFYLNRGSVNGKVLLPAAAINRMEIPTSTWAAKEGLKAGYGLCNYWSVYDGFVYHGHNGRLEGGITDMAYIPEKEVGYYYSINSDNITAFTQIGKIIRAYITHTLEKPFVPLEAALPQHASEYSGWYELDSPRKKHIYFLERLLNLTAVCFEKNKLIMTSLREKKAQFIPVMENQFRAVHQKESPDPIATVSLLTPNVKGKFIQIGTGMITMKRISTWLAITEIFLVAFVLLSVVSILIYAPFWIFCTIMKKEQHPKENIMRLLPLVAVLSIVSAFVLYIKSGDFSGEFFRLGNLTGWSLSIFLTTIIFAVTSVGNIVVLWFTPKEEVRSSVRTYSIIVTSALMMTTIYLAYFGIIGLRTWA